MHEIGICQELVAAALRRSAGRRVAVVTVRVGALHRVDGPSMDQAFQLLTEGTELAGASLDMAVIPVQMTCAACGKTSESEAPLAACPHCRALDVHVSGGEDLMLESIRLMPLTAAGTPGP